MPEWPPRFARAWVDKAAQKVIAAQRKVFITMLGHQIPKAIVPLDGAGPLDAAVVERVKDATQHAAALLIEKHMNSLPDGCPRAPAHLQMVSLTIAAQREIFAEARREGSDYQATTQFRVRSSVADLLGVVAPPDGTEPVAVPASW